MLVNFVSFNTHLLTRAPWGQERGKRRIMSFLLLKPLKIGKKIPEFIFAIAVSHCSLDQNDLEDVSVELDNLYQKI